MLMTELCWYKVLVEENIEMVIKRTNLDDKNIREVPYEKCYDCNGYAEKCEEFVRYKK